MCIFVSEYKFPLPTLVYSDFEDGCGVMVMEDWAPKKFKLDQPDLMRLLDPGHCLTQLIKLGNTVFHFIIFEVGR